MKTSTVIFFVASVLLYADSTYGQCSQGELEAPCGSVCEPSCRVPNPQMCTLECMLNGCRCREGLLRDERSGKCVLATQCGRGSGSEVIVVENSCGPNESVASCGPVCEPTCNNPNPVVCPENCILNGCRCNPGFFRDRFQRCVDRMGCMARG